MILQSLYKYYQRKAAINDASIAPEGWEWKEFPFLCVMDENGEFKYFKDTREGNNQLQRGHQYCVPALGEKKGNGIKSNLFWENIEYMFGIPVPTKFKPFPVSKRVKQQHDSFREKINSLVGSSHYLDVVKKFVSADQSKIITKDSNWVTVLSTNRNILLSIENNNGVFPVTDLPEIRQIIYDRPKNDGITGICLITGDRVELAMLEPPIRGVAGADRKAERAFVSFNKDAFCSYHKIKNYNSPIGKRAALAYAQGLNILLERDSRNKVRISDTTILFWANQQPKVLNLEEIFPWFISDQQIDNPDSGIQKIKSLYDAVFTGRLRSENDNQFFVLGLSPNSARISVRFWKVSTVEDVGLNIFQHFKDLEIVNSDFETSFFSLNELIAAVSIETKDKTKSNVIAFKGKLYDPKPNLTSEIIESILNGSSYPLTFIHGCIRRIRSDVSRKNTKGKLMANVTRARAAILKAFLNRKHRIYNHSMKEITMALNPKNDDVGYVLGRLFALLEIIQERSTQPHKLNSTIRERYYNSLSSSPKIVLPLLMRLKNHHLAKLERGLKLWYEGKLAEIMNLLDGKNIPSHLTLEQQCQFAVGYYHQRAYKEKKDN